MLVDNVDGVIQCFAVFIDGFGQVFKVFVVLTHDFFQTQTGEVVVLDIFLGCFFAGNIAFFINDVDVVSDSKTVDVLGI